MGPTLYRVQTRTDAIEGYDDVLISWAAAGRTAPVAPYADVIEGLGSGDEAELFRRNAVDELFTFEEAQAWAAYLQRHYSKRVRRWWSSLYHCQGTPWPSLICLWAAVWIR
jgi:hypothetical protein